MGRMVLAHYLRGGFFLPWQGKRVQKKSILKIDDKGLYITVGKTYKMKNIQAVSIPLVDHLKGYTKNKT